ncbi:MAG TPA: bifunctional demethylmenaquinone methyltransferase/2-methoxy-6-polyprenyl-1,4-benzoquinol methylase UbiE [Firmicutes bacterium]|jgi:demethylmenaquinone methyltransferase/2-methoxy-6-polyprenyl-1,4-benzoquinol methylase|nr:bifunctional demethylmenaquinone methyltransferase/2-methoxy-6-polyprenyl-1,4-benzoquinol methylase UbiE [Bacillota bacterium]
MPLLPKPHVSLYASDKAQYIQALFSQIAPRYDGINRVLSLGRDLAWRRRAAAQCALQPGRQVLDVATGTGDLAFSLACHVAPHGQVIGLDLNAEMLAIARKKAGKRDPYRVCRFIQGDALQLPFPDHAFHAVTIGFALRNVTDISTCLAQMYRVLKPDGRMVCLELARPEKRVWRQLHAVYLRLIIPGIGRLGHGVAAPYQYLANSLTDFPGRKQLVQLMLGVGFKQVHYVNLLGGVATIHVGIA